MKTTREFEKEFLLNIREETGRDLFQWMEIIKDLPDTGREDIIVHLMQVCGVSFRQAALLASVFLNDRKPRYG